MLNPRLAGRYAKSLLDLAKEQNQLDRVFEDVNYLSAACRANRELVTMLKSPVIPADRKEAVLDGLTKGKVTELTAAFNRLLVRKGREAVLPEILTAFIDQYKSLKKIRVVKLTTATPVSEALKNEIIRKVQEGNTDSKIDLEVLVDPAIIGGFVLEMGDTLVDASIAYDLNAIKKQFMNNDFIYNIR